MTKRTTVTRRAILCGTAALTAAGATAMATDQAEASDRLVDLIRRHSELLARRDALAAEVANIEAEGPPCSPPIGIHEILPVQACWQQPGTFWTEPVMVEVFFDEQIRKVERYRSDARPEYRPMYDAEIERLAHGRSFGVAELQRRIDEHAAWLKSSGWKARRETLKQLDAEEAELAQAILEQLRKTAGGA